MARTIKKVFTLTDGATGLRLTWHAGTDLPDFAVVPAVAARTTPAGFEWATADTVCPHCRKRFPITFSGGHDEASDSRDISEMLLTNETAVLLIVAVGNAAIDTSAPLNATCPSCGESFLVSMDARERELAVHIDDRCIALKCPGGETVYFLSGGGVLASEKQLKGTPAAEAIEFSAIPLLLGVSREAKEWLCWALGIKLPDGAENDDIDVLDLALRYRFKGYDEGFFAEARASIMRFGSRAKLLNGLFALPRSFTDRNALAKLFKKSGLPDKPSVRKAAAARPVALALAARARLGKLCKGDPNLAVTLLRSDRLDAVWVGSMLDRKGELCGFIELAANEEKAGYILQRLLSLDAGTLARGIYEFNALSLDPFEELKAYRLARKSYSLTEIIKRPKLLEAYARSNESINITYGASSSLQGEFDGYRFTLPRRTSRFEAAGATLKNCLGDGYGKSAALGNTLVFLVSKERKLVAAVEVQPERRAVMQMYAKANRRISPTEDLGIAIARWAKDKGIGLSGCNYG